MQSATDEEQHSLQHGAKWMHSLLLQWSPWDALSLCLGHQQCLARLPPQYLPFPKGSFKFFPWECPSICHGGFQAIKPALNGSCIRGPSERNLNWNPKFMRRCPEIKLVTEFFMRSYLNTTHLLLHVLSIQMHRFMLDKIQINLLLHILERDVLATAPWLSLSPPHTSPWIMLGMRALSSSFSGPHFLLHNTVALSGPQGHLQLTDTVSVA